MDTREHRFETWLRIVFLALLALLVVLCGLLLTQYDRLRAFGAPTMHAHHPALPVTSAAFVQPWMTYDYIDHIYALPPDYLKESLSIADSRYPRVSISQSADAQHESAAQLTTAVQQAIQDYLPTNGQ